METDSTPFQILFLLFILSYRTVLSSTCELTSEGGKILLTQCELSSP